MRREIRERPKPQCRAAEERHQCARMKNLGAVVRQLRRFAYVEKGHDTRPRNETRVGSHHTSDILP